MVVLPVSNRESGDQMFSLVTMPAYGHTGLTDDLRTVAVIG